MDRSLSSRIRRSAAVLHPHGQGIGLAAWNHGQHDGHEPPDGPGNARVPKNSVKLQGMPLLQNVSFGMSGTGMPQNTGAGSQAQASQPASQQQQAQEGTVPATPKERSARVWE